MPRAAQAVLATALVLCGALLVASLALVSILPTWGLLFFYVLPSFFVGVWTARELVPARWRRLAVPLRRRWRLSRLAGAPVAPPAAAAPPPEGRGPGRLAPLATAARLWLRGLRPVFALLRSRRGRRLSDAVVVLAGAALVALVARELVATGWPAKRLQPLAAAAAAAFFFSTFALRAFGWQRLFRPIERPRSLVLVTSTGTSEVVSLALPPRIGDAIGISIVRKLTLRRAPSIGTTALSLFVLGLLDIAAIVPLAAYATIRVHADAAVHVGLLVVMGVGVGAAVVAAALPSIRTSERLMRRGLGHWLALHAPVSRRDTLWSWFLVCGSWLARAAALLLLLDALGLGGSFTLAAAYVVAGAGASSLPVGPAGAATEAGAGAAVLAGAGVSKAQAIALAVTAQGMTAAAGGLLALLGVSLARRSAR